MPTSKGLSYSTCSLPRSECTIGALSMPASLTISAWAPAQPAPHIRVMRSPSFRIFASASMSASGGITTGGAGASHVAALASVD